MEETQGLTPYDAIEAGGVFREREAATRLFEGDGCHGARLPDLAPVKRIKAVLTSRAPEFSSTHVTSPLARTRPWCRTTSLSLGMISSNRWVAHRTPMPCSVTRWRT